ncbi:[FeFe] hydrogenase H-cluster maturation GTPase HydF [Proteinivorax hydrogeniformans]|uniref:[FeFe] hydrogenase H-cluster maturation GTPase HydF n=1 Tax=Proteinivorax hydrogeniformans TaxID=1826727 RepID=A0AAU8HTC4_9FIRM
MQNTPRGSKKHIAIYGKTNSGKSTLLNSMIGQEISIVSDVKGTTTDPVIKSMELIPFGPVVFIDTAGLDDDSELGSLRVNKTLKILQRTDFAIYVLDVNDPNLDDYYNALDNFKKYNIPYLTVVNKMDTVLKKDLNDFMQKLDNPIAVSALENQNILQLKDEIINRLQKKETDPPIVGDLVPYGGNVLMVVPIDSEAPKGRLILPQVQVIRDCLDHGIKCHVVRDTELNEALSEIKDIDLVITDSQAFGEVNKIVPKEMSLTSFSILFARYKGDLETFVYGIEKLKELNGQSKVLISESCTHNHSHEDIGRVKIPRMIKKHIDENIKFDFKMGNDFPEDIEGYDLVIHCGSCMVNKKTMMNRIRFCQEKSVAITNYGIILAYFTGAFPRCVEFFNLKLV